MGGNITGTGVPSYSFVSLFLLSFAFLFADYTAARAQYNYTAAIPEELSFAKGDILAIMRYQDDGWWEAEVAGKNQRPGLVPSNYLMPV